MDASEQADHDRLHDDIGLQEQRDRGQRRRVGGQLDIV
jgi:hypothetical protein